MKRLVYVAVIAAMLAAGAVGGILVTHGDAAPGGPPPPLVVADEAKLLDEVEIQASQEVFVDLTTTGYRYLRLVLEGDPGSINVRPYVDGGTTLITPSNLPLTAGSAVFDHELLGIDKVQIKVRNTTSATRTVSLNSFLSR